MLTETSALPQVI